MLSNNELYGSFDEGTHEWQVGVLARIMRNVCKDESPDQKWILFDGPVDTLWIESMNTLLDDNKLLTLLSGERISMSPQACTLLPTSHHVDPHYATVPAVCRGCWDSCRVSHASWLDKQQSLCSSESSLEPLYSETA